SEHEWDKVENDLRRLAQDAFKKHFAELDVSFEFEIDLERGSIRGRIRTTGRVIARALKVMVVVATVGQSAEYLWDRTTGSLTTLEAQVEQYFEVTHGVADTIRTERRRGAVARLDHVINMFQQGQITYDEYMAEA